MSVEGVVSVLGVVVVELGWVGWEVGAGAVEEGIVVVAEGCVSCFCLHAARESARTSTSAMMANLFMIFLLAKLGDKWVKG